MRLPPDDNIPVRTLLKEAELLQKPRPTSEAPPSDCEFAGLRRDMGGTCCPASECGGFCAGRRFPNFGMSNQFLKPVHFANLCSLGAELAEPMISALLQTGRRVEAMA